MANKRALNICAVNNSCAKKRKVSDECIGSSLPQLDGLTDDSTDGKVFGFAPKVTQTSNISHSSYAPVVHANMFTNGHFPSKMSLDEKNFMPQNHLGPLISGFGMQQSFSRMPHCNPPRDFNEISMQLTPSAPDAFKRINASQQGYMHSTNGAFSKTAYTNGPSLCGVEEKMHMKKGELQNSTTRFVGQFSSTNGPASYYSSFMDKRMDFGLENVSFLGQPAMMNPQNPPMYGELRNFHPSLVNNSKAFGGHFPYLRTSNIPESSSMQNPYTHSRQFGHNVSPLENHQIFPSRPRFPFPSSTQSWSARAPENGEFRCNDLAPAAFLDNARHALTKNDYLIRKVDPEGRPSEEAVSADPMKMIEKFSASHFNSSFPKLKNEDWSKNDGTNQEKSTGSQQPVSQPHNEKKNLEHKASSSSSFSVENSEKRSPCAPEKKTKRAKKNGEQVKYEAWLYEKRKALRGRLAALEHEMLTIPSEKTGSDSCRELRGHFESAIAQLSREATEHEALIRVFKSSKNISSGSKNDTPCSDKPAKPAKSHGASSHLNSNGTSCSKVSHKAAHPNKPPSHQPKNQDGVASTNTCRPPTSTSTSSATTTTGRVAYEKQPLPKIMEPSTVLHCSVNVKGWPSENEKPRTTEFKQEVNVGFRPSDALSVLDALPKKGDFKALRMEDLCRKVTSQLGVGKEGIGDVEDQQDDSKNGNEFRVSSDWLFLNKKQLSVDSCLQCCKTLNRTPIVDSVVVEMGRHKVNHSMKFCCESCMTSHREKRKIWERDKQLHEQIMKFEENEQQSSSGDPKRSILDGGRMPNLVAKPKEEVKVKLEKEEEEGPDSTKKKKWKNVRYGSWCQMSNLMKRQKKEIVFDDKKTSHLSSSVHIPPGIRDARSCFLCGSVGDGDGNGCGRLLAMDIDRWVHANCSLWSSNVYEALDGTFIGSKNFCGSTCAGCDAPGATVTCFLPNCGLKFHLRCAVSLGVCFLENKVTYCRHHCPKNMLALIVKDISINRRVCIERQESQQVAKMLRQEDPENYSVRLGNLVVHSFGHLLPQFVHTLKFNTCSSIYPVGYRSVRFYWSFRRLHHRCQYTCSIGEREGAPVFRIVVEEEREADVAFESDTCTGVWTLVLDHLDALRRAGGLSRVFTEYLSGEDLFGLNEPAVRRVIESLPGVELLYNCRLKYGKCPMYVPPLAPNPSGCIRSEPKSKMLFKRSHTLLGNFNAGSSAKSTWLGSGEFSIAQYMKQFTATKSQRYRSLKTEWRNNVYLRRSNIQGLGLFAGRELEQFTMVIEYIGELIRNEIAEIREKIYEQQNRGVYMFRLDENAVIDATMTGGPARYINHCCDPNCFTEVVPTEKGNKIVIIAKRKILSGEELSYDYKFNLEDEKSKIPCLCGAANCTKWMN